jgi:L-threonylcarbamoyladenylate synthase
LPRNVFWLDARGELRGVARRLFATLRKIDALGFERMHVELAPGEGLATAINDRLRRAASR